MELMERQTLYLNTTEQPIKVNYKLLPREAIEEVVVNDEAFSWLPQRFHCLLDKDNLLSMRVVTVPPKENVSLRSTTVNYQEGRAIPVAQLEEPLIYPGGVATYISAKGVNLSGPYYHDLTNIQKEHDPIGFFGDSDCISDIAGSNRFLAEGGRVALSLGYLVIDSVKLGKTLKANWKRYNYQEILNRIEMVERNNDNLAIHIRLGGTRHRLRSTDVIKEKKYFKDNSPHIRNEIRKGADLLVQSVNMPTFNDYCQLGNLSASEVADVFKAIRDRNMLDNKQVYVIKSFILGFALSEASKLARAIIKSNYNTSLFYYPSNAGSKDVDTSLMIYDFESFGKCTMKKHVTDLDEKRKLSTRCANWGAGIAVHYLQNLSTFRYIPPNCVPITSSVYTDHVKNYVDHQIGYSS